MIWLLARRNIVDRPWRSALLLFGYALGVAVMIVLLSVGEALLVQARDEKLVGGGQITVLPEGIDVEVMKTGGLGGMFFSIDHARFIHLQLLASPRLAPSVLAVAPQIDGKLLYLTAHGIQRPIRASGEIPSRSRAVGGATSLASGRWNDDDLDRRWRSPTRGELNHDIDRFHLPPDSGAAESWAEWHYFNVLSADSKRWVFITYMVAGNVPNGRWGGQLLVTVREQGRRTRRFISNVHPERVRFSLVDANVRIGGSSVTALEDGRYMIQGDARQDGGGSALRFNFTITPEPRAYFPGATLREGETVSGYAVAGLRAAATGTVCIDASCERFTGAQSYKDHNWGSWRGVTWEWGATRAGSFGILYGVVHAPGSDPAAAPLFLYLVDSHGFRSLFRPRRITYEDEREITVDGRRVRVPSRAVLADVRGDDTLRLELKIEDAIGTDIRRTLLERGTTLARPYFIQMKGRARLTGRVGGVRIEGEGTGFFETYR
jgi:hypothetical protein